jgi:nicotinamide-nucleotide amidase
MKEVNACIITIGDELLIGQTIDTNSAFIAQELNRIGIWVKRRIAIGDVKEEILSTLGEQSRDCAVIIITGGLGPTADDITKPTLCEYFNAKLVVDEGALQNVENIFARLNRPLIERNLKQAEVPDNCIVLPNLRGTAPGMWWEKEGVLYASLPVPHEMKGLMQNAVIPKLEESLELPAVVHRSLVTSGVGESTIADTVLDFENNLPEHIRLAYLPAYGVVRLRLTGRDSNKVILEKEMDEQFEKLKPFVKKWMIAEKDISLEEAVSQLLKEKKKTLATAESCTGGNIARLITSIAGSSAIYNGSVVSYANKIKESVLGVSRQTLEERGAVSEETVTAMVQGILTLTGSDYAIATSGIMGPGGGTAEKPVGTVWIAVGNTGTIRASKHFFRFDRSRNIEMTTQTALTLLHRFVLEQEP